MCFVLCMLHKGISHRNKNTTLNKKRKGSSLKRRLFIYTLSNLSLVNDCYFPTDLTAFVRNSQSDCPMSARPALQHDNHQLPIRYCTCCK